MAAKKTKTIDRALVNQISDDVSKALEDIAKKYGVTFSRGGGRFDASSFRIARVEFSVPSSVGDTAPKSPVSKKDEDDFRRHCHLYGIKPEALGQTIEGRGGKKLKLAGFSPRKRKNPFLLLDEKGGVFVAPPEYIRGMLPSNFVTKSLMFK